MVHHALLRKSMGRRPYSSSRRWQNMDRLHRKLCNKTMATTTRNTKRTTTTIQSQKGKMAHNTPQQSRRPKQNQRSIKNHRRTLKTPSNTVVKIIHKTRQEILLVAVKRKGGK